MTSNNNVDVNKEREKAAKERTHVISSLKNGIEKSINYLSYSNRDERDAIMDDILNAQSQIDALQTNI